MIPNIEILTEEITETQYPGRTYKINFDANISKQKVKGAVLGTAILGEMVVGDSGYTPEDEANSNRINGYVDDLEAVKQAIYLILNTERYQFVIYSWDYGVELLDLIGQPIPYVMSELPRRITDALTQDDRIEDVVDFEFEQNGKKLHTTFTVVSNLGNMPAELEVEV